MMMLDNNNGGGGFNEASNNDDDGNDDNDDDRRTMQSERTTASIEAVRKNVPARRRCCLRPSYKKLVLCLREKRAQRVHQLSN